MRRGVAFFAAVLVVLATAGSASAALRLAHVAGGFNGPIHVASAAGDDGHLYIVEQRGVIKRYTFGSGERTTFLDIRGRVGCCGERGLLSVAFHPDYAQNRRFFVNYTRNDGDVVVARYKANDAGTRAVRSSRRQRLRVEHSEHTNHNGGTLFFTSGCALHVSIGDGGSGGDPPNNAQRINNRKGKLVRIDTCGTGAKIVALGLRNPWRLDRDPETGLVYVADVGQNSWEEISIWRPSRSGLENFGWSRFEGDHLYNSNRSLYRGSDYIRPIDEYAHASGRCSITGGIVVRSQSVAEAYGRYFYGDFCTGEVWSFRYANGTITGARTEAFSLPGGSLVSFGRGPRGQAYVVNRNGTISRIAAA